MVFLWREQTARAPTMTPAPATATATAPASAIDIADKIENYYV